MATNVRDITAKDNNPPSDAESLHANLTERAAAVIKTNDDLIAAYGRAPEVIDNEVDAGKMTHMVKLLTGAEGAAEKRREEEKKPFLESGRVVDAFFRDLAKPITDAKTAILKRLTAYQVKVEAAERLRRQEEARKAEEAAEAARQEAQRKLDEAAKVEVAEVQADNDGQLALTVTTGSQELVQEAIAAEESAGALTVAATIAASEAAAPTAELTRTRSGYGSTSSLSRSWALKSIDKEKVDLEKLRPYLTIADLEKAGRAYVKAGGRELRGAVIAEEASAKVR